VAQLLRQAGLQARVVRRDKAPTDSRHAFPVADHVLAHRCTALRPPAVGMGDITSLGTDDGGLYLATREDLATRPIVGWALDPHMTQDLPLAARDRAVARHRPPAGVLPHADRGSQAAA
jgi:putative transposase